MMGQRERLIDDDKFDTLVSAVADLHERVRRLEGLHAKSNRGRVNQRRAAEYLGRSREFLRQIHLRGEGPRRGTDGSYSIEDLDCWAEQHAQPGDK